MTVTKVTYHRATIYVHHDGDELQSAHLGGDYLDITQKLTPADKAKLIKLAIKHCDKAKIAGF